MNPRPVIPSRKGAAHGRNLGHWLLGMGYRLRVYNPDRVPRKGRVILAANHRGLLDGPLLTSVAPRPAHLLTRSDLFSPPADRALAAFGHIPFDPAIADRSAIARAVNVLGEGQAIAMFPEGDRDGGDFSRMYPWIAYLAGITGAPIVPVVILGTWPPGLPRDGLPPFRSRLVVSFGNAFQPEIPGDPYRRAVIGSVAEQIRQRLADEVALVSTENGGSW